MNESFQMNKAADKAWLMGVMQRKVDIPTWSKYKDAYVEILSLINKSPLRDDILIETLEEMYVLLQYNYISLYTDTTVEDKYRVAALTDILDGLKKGDLSTESLRKIKDINDLKSYYANNPLEYRHKKNNLYPGCPEMKNMYKGSF